MKIGQLYVINIFTEKLACLFISNVRIPSVVRRHGTVYCSIISTATASIHCLKKIHSCATTVLTFSKISAYRNRQVIRRRRETMR